MTIDDNVYSSNSVLSLTMIDGKKIVAGWRIPFLKISPNSHLKPSSMDDLEALKTRQIVAENVKLSISSLHAWIKWFESLRTYRLDIKKLFARKADRLLVDASKS
ncbi:hypothetical protein TNIN_148571 [Trichonephila inaurata madagascariensis]|uniref:Uncharacterized protein n=1 Tax=Trichonephila inaurata madagascariensis TaxID=2747483 RepID=A0A8X6X3J4_9ARAC|nr:hypothetical protein TNIN_148571 [Trichonephila inaurata madagascariensis]